MAFLFLAESQDSIEPWKSGSISSPIVKTIDTLNPFYCLACGKAGFHLRLYGTISEPCKEKTCQKSTFSSVVPLARISVLREMERASRAITASLCLNTCASLASSDHNTHSWRTYQASLFGGLTKFSWDSMRYGMTVAGQLFSPKRWEPRFSENVSSSWPRPVASDTGTWINKSKSKGAKDGPSLGAIAKTWRWPRPLSTDASKGGPNQLKGGYPSMANIAANWKRWSRPHGRDWKVAT